MGFGSFADTTRAGRSAKRMSQTELHVRKRSVEAGSRDVLRTTETRQRQVGADIADTVHRGAFSTANQCERFDVPSNQECASAVTGHPDGCPAVGAPRPRSPASRAARPRAPRRAQGDRARRSSQGVEPRAAKVQGHQRVWWTDRAHRPGRHQNPDTQAITATIS